MFIVRIIVRNILLPRLRWQHYWEYGLERLKVSMMENLSWTIQGVSLVHIFHTLPVLPLMIPRHTTHYAAMESE